MAANLHVFMNIIKESKIYVLLSLRYTFAPFQFSNRFSYIYMVLLHSQVSSSEYFCVYFDGANGLPEKEEFIPAVKGVSLEYASLFRTQTALIAN